MTPILRYDPLGRLIRTDLPNGTFSKVVFDPWKQTTFDPNDTVTESLWYDPAGAGSLRSGWRASNLAADHAGTRRWRTWTLFGADVLDRSGNGKPASMLRASPWTSTKETRWW
ncbi:MAG: hypothetical protein U0359_36005 [Byssovorax sp.]